MFFTIFFILKFAEFLLIKHKKISFFFFLLFFAWIIFDEAAFFVFPFSLLRLPRLLLAPSLSVVTTTACYCTGQWSRKKTTSWRRYADRGSSGTGLSVIVLDWTTVMERNGRQIFTLIIFLFWLHFV